MLLYWILLAIATQWYYIISYCNIMGPQTYMRSVVEGLHLIMWCRTGYALCFDIFLVFSVISSFKSCCSLETNSGFTSACLFLLKFAEWLRSSCYIEQRSFLRIPLTNSLCWKLHPCIRLRLLILHRTRLVSEDITSVQAQIDSAPLSRLANLVKRRWQQKDGAAPKLIIRHNDVISRVNYL
jgi:hypothetical protein